MDYLNENQLYSSLYSLEKESQISLFKFSNELEFLRTLILDGQWSDAGGFIDTIFENVNFAGENQKNQKFE